jgi:pSer/pThr/pTyr-binding forkhead associated (FHA) protein
VFNITVKRIDTGLLVTAGTLASRELSIGRSERSQLILKDDTVSGTHCRLVAIEGGTLVLDEGSTNGTWVNGERLLHPTLVSSYDSLVIGPYVLSVLSLIGRGTSGCTQVRRPRPRVHTHLTQQALTRDDWEHIQKLTP